MVTFFNTIRIKFDSWIFRRVKSILRWSSQYVFKHGLSEVDNFGAFYDQYKIDENIYIRIPSHVRNLLYNAIRTPDGTVLESKHVHDYVTHEDTISGEQYMVDGGTYYRKRNRNKVPYEDLSLYTGDNFQDIREVVRWGSRGKDGRQPVQFKKLSEMSNNHLFNLIIYFQNGMVENDKMERIVKEELDYRIKDGILIDDE